MENGNIVEIKFESNEGKFSTFNLYEEGRKIGEMGVGIKDGKLTVYHTEVAPESEGRGYAKQLLNAMVAYAREHSLKVVPLCPYVHMQFKRHTDEYADVWYKPE